MRIYWPSQPRWLVASWLFAVASIFVGVSAKAEVARIVSIDGQYSLEHASTMNVKPGDVVRLSADVLRETFGSSSYEPMNEYVEDFQWSSRSDSGSTYECDADRSEDCLKNSYFEVTDFGVNFYVPEDMGREITLTVRHKITYEEDQITLVNEDYRIYTPPSQPAFDGDDYNESEISPERALSGHGRWVKINSQRYFTPYSHEDDWAPYRHGYWQWDDEQGWVWSSYDPWGWYTDHYGVWRYHRVYGWVWRPLDDGGWKPHTVTWVYGDQHIGWYPYYRQRADLYREGYEHGWSDGFWDGYNAGRYYHNTNYGHRYELGYTAVRHNHFYGSNIYDYWSSYSVTVRIGWFHWSYDRSYYGDHIGGRDHRYSRTWVDGYTRQNPPIVRIVTRRIGGRVIRTVKHIHGVPGVYGYTHVVRRDVWKSRTRLPVGTVIKVVRNGNGRIIDRSVIERPTLNGRGIADAPRRSYGSEMRPVESRVRHQAELNPNNPYRGRREGIDGVRPDPVRPDPVRPDPVRPDPGRPGTRPDPVRPDPVRPDPVRPDPGRPGTRPDPVRPDPVRPDPVRPDPGRPGTRPDPVRPDPVRPDPVRPDPGRPGTRPDPVRPDPVRPDPVRPDPGRPGTRPDPVRPDPVRPDPVRPDPGRPGTRPDPVRPNPVRPDPVRPDPGRPGTRPDPVRPDPVRPDPVRPDPGRPGTRPDPVRPDPGRPSRPEPDRPARPGNGGGGGGNDDDRPGMGRRR